MAKIIPFKALRPNPSIVEKVASPPYDVMDSNEAREMAKTNPDSFLHIIKPEIDLDAGVDPYGEPVYAKGKENFHHFIDNYVLLREEKPYFYLYQLIWGDHVQTGFVACASVDDYLEGRIKKHEFTRPEKVKDRANLMQALGAQTGPVFLAYKQTEELAQLAEMLLEKAELVNDFKSVHDVQHKFYKVDYSPYAVQIQNAFERLPSLYIADGHHRSETAAFYCKKMRDNQNCTGHESFNYFLSVIFPDSDLKVLPYNRAVQDLNGMSQTDFLNAIHEKFKIEPVTTDFNGPQMPESFGMYLDKKWYMLSAREEIVPYNDPVESLDVAVLQNHLLKPLLGIDDPRTSTRIKFIGGIRGNAELVNLVDSGAFAVAFSMYPTSMQQVMDVADAGKVMPPKSTWFEPKLLSGLVTHVLD